MDGLIQDNGRMHLSHGSTELIVDATKRFLAKSTLPWLLILDSKDNLNTFDVESFFPRQQSGKSQKCGHILLTSRCISSHFAHTITLQGMPQEEAMKLLEKRGRSDRGRNDRGRQDRGPSISIKDAQKIVKNLDCVPLAIALAGAYISQETVKSFNLTMISNESNRHKYGQYPAIGETHNQAEYSRNLMRIWKTSFDGVKKRDFRATDVLILCLFWASEELSLEMLCPGLIQDSIIRDGQRHHQT
jgi:hypothetical protein